jgi:hypothetical protein
MRLLKIEPSRAAQSSARRFGKNSVRKAIDLTLYLVFCSLAGTGFLLAYRLPHGAGNVRVTFLGYELHDWALAHTWLAYFALGLLVVQLVLNREWLVKIAASKRTWQLVIPILSGLLIVAAFLLFPLGRRL